jgi:membrane protein required for colicin V production
MNFADWLIVGAILLSVVLAAAQGFLYEAFSLAGVIVGYLVAAWWYESAAAWFAPYVKATWVANVAGYLTLFLAVVLLAGIIGRIARAGAKAAGMRWFDRVLGGAFGLLRGFLLVMVMLMAFAAWAPTSTWLAESQLAPYMLVVGRAAIWVAPSDVRAQFQNGMKQLRELRAGPKSKPANH